VSLLASANGPRHSKPSIAAPQEDRLQEFLTRYPVDERAEEYLMTSEPAVVARALVDFRPPHEGEQDYSGLLTSYVKRLRQQCLTDAAASSYAASNRPRRLPFETAPQAEHTIVHEPREDDLTQIAEEFCARYPTDESARHFLLTSTAEVQARVFECFQPPREGEEDYSALLTTFIKKCRAEVSNRPMPVATRPREAGRQQVVPVQTPTQRVLHTAAPLARHAAAFEETSVELAEGLEALVERYPIDVAAQDFLTTSSLEVQIRVLNDFRPPREGESDYSALLTTFVKKCRAEAPGRAPTAVHQPQVTVHQVGRSDEVLDALESLAMRYPIDDRARDYFLSSSAMAREKILREFRPPHEGEPDYSSLFMSYVKRCRQSVVDEVSNRGAQASRPHGTASPSMGSATTSYHSRHEQEAVQESDTGALEEALNAFLERYPVDARAIDFLTTSSPSVIDQVVREFKPKKEGDADYSAIVMTFTKRCREQERSGAAGSREPPWKRPRVL